MPLLRRRLLPLLLPVLAAGNSGDWLYDWQRAIWDGDPEVLFFGTTDAWGSDRAGTFRRSGASPKIPGNPGFQTPIEFAWNNEAALTPEQQQLIKFDVRDIGQDQAYLIGVHKQILGLVTRVRKLGDRWVAMILHNGEPAALHYVWAKQEKPMYPGLPVQNFQFLNMHAYKIKNCAVTEESVVFQFLPNSGASWELKIGMADPLAACDGPYGLRTVDDADTSAAVESEEQWPGNLGVSPGARNCHAADIIDSVLQDRLTGDTAYTEFLSALADDPCSSIQHVTTLYNFSSLSNAVCSVLDKSIDFAREHALVCTDDLRLAIYKLKLVWAPTGSLSSDMLTALTEGQAVDVLTGPREHWLACLQKQETMIAFIQQETESAMQMRAVQAKLESLEHTLFVDRMGAIFALCLPILAVGLLCMRAKLRPGTMLVTQGVHAGEPADDDVALDLDTQVMRQASDSGSLGPWRSTGTLTGWDWDHYVKTEEKQTDAQSGDVEMQGDTHAIDTAAQRRASQVQSEVTVQSSGRSSRELPFRKSANLLSPPMSGASSWAQPQPQPRSMANGTSSQRSQDDRHNESPPTAERKIRSTSPMPTNRGRTLQETQQAIRSKEAQHVLASSSFSSNAAFDSWM